MDSRKKGHRLLEGWGAEPHVILLASLLALSNHFGIFMRLTFRIHAPCPFKWESESEKNDNGFPFFENRETF